MDKQTGSPVNEEQEFYLRWGYESIKANLQLANDVLRQLLTLSAALLGSGVYFRQNEAIPAQLIAPTLILLLIALVASLLGVLPFRGTVDLSSPDKIKEHKNSALTSKRRYIFISAVSLVLALILAGVGVVVKLW